MSTTPLSWSDIRPWKTPFTVGRRLEAVCSELQATGVEEGAILQALFLAVYDLASADDTSSAADLMFREMRDFGTAGLAALPKTGASAALPEWEGVVDSQRRAGEACQSVWALCETLKYEDKVSHFEIIEGLLRHAGERLAHCDEPSRRYWYRQFQLMGARGYAIAYEAVFRKPPPENPGVGSLADGND